MKKILFLLFSAYSFSAIAQTVTWSTHIAPILYNRCSSCHHGGGAGHGDFVKYDSAVYYAGGINYMTSSGKMPPWPPNPNYRHYAQERILTAQEKADIQTWINTGTPLGDTNLAPPTPVFSGGSMLTTTPDVSFSMPTFTIPSMAGNDVYWNFVIPTGTTQTNYIKGFEFIPGNTSLVHHALIFADTGNTVLNNDAAYPGLGYPGFGGINSNTAKLLGAYVPGSTPFMYPSGFGLKLPQNALLVFNIHYPANAVGLVDSSKINIYYANGSIREVFFNGILNNANMTNGPLFIPANQTKTFYQAYNIPGNYSVFGVAPHMHLIGRKIKVYATSTANDTIPMIDIPDWNFKWQGAYYFQKIQKITNSYVLRGEAFYDNTTSNPLNPSSPPLDVSFGENTKDEMLLTYLAYTPYQNGDENIIIDSTLLFPSAEQNHSYYRNIEIFPLYPNPASALVYLKMYTAKSEDIQIKIYDYLGKVVHSLSLKSTSGYHVYPVQLSELAKGLYLFETTSNENRQVQKLIIQ